MSAPKSNPCRFCGALLSAYNLGKVCNSCTRADAAAVIPPYLWQHPKMRSALASHDFGTVLTLLREATPLTQHEIANLVGMSQAEISRIQNRHHKVTHTRVLFRFVEGLRIPINLVLPGQLRNLDIDSNEDSAKSGSDEAWRERVEPKKIAFLLPSRGGQPFYSSALTGLVRSASLELSQDYVIFPSMPRQSFESMSIWEQFAILEDSQDDFDGIIFIPDNPDGHFKELVGFHEDRGRIPLVLMDVYFDVSAYDASTRTRFPSFVGGDEFLGGRIAGDIMIAALGLTVSAEPAIFVLNGWTAPWEQRRAAAFRNRIREEWQDARFIESPPINYSRKKAFAYTIESLRALSNSSKEVELHGVFACNDDMAIGARSAVMTMVNEGYSFPCPPQIVGYDGIPEIYEYIVASDLYIAGTVDVKIEDQARAAMLLMHRMVRSGQRLSSDIHLMTPQAVVRRFIGDTKGHVCAD